MSVFVRTIPYEHVNCTKITENVIGMVSYEDSFGLGVKRHHGNGLINQPRFYAPMGVWTLF